MLPFYTAALAFSWVLCCCVEGEPELTRGDTLVFRGFILILAIIYFPGMIYSAVFPEEFSDYYSHVDNILVFSLPLVLFFLFCFSMQYFVVARTPRIKLLRFSNLPFNIVFLILSLVYFLISVFFFLKFDPGFRHNSRLAEGGALIAVLFFLKPLVHVYALFYLVFILNGGVVAKLPKLTLILFFLGSLLSINSSLQVVALFLILALIAFPQVFLKPMYKFGPFNLSAVFLGLPIIIVSAIIMGIGNKVGFDFLFSNEGLSYFQNFVGKLFARMSSSLMSLSIIGQRFLFDSSLSLESLESFLATFYNRASIIFFGHSSFDSSLIDTVNRSNYLNVFASHADRAGASPGIISSIFFLPIYPLGFLVLPFFLVWSARMISFHLLPIFPGNILALFCLGYFVLPVFEAPLNVFYVFDPIVLIPFSLLMFRFIDIGSIYGKWD